MKLNPITRKRLQRFKSIRHAYGSFWILLALFVVSLFSELICNDKPFYVRFNGRSYFPIFRAHSDDLFTDNGRLTPPDYKQLRDSDAFAPGSGNRMVFPPVPYGPMESIQPGLIEVEDEVTITLMPQPSLATVVVLPDLTIEQESGAELFFGAGDTELAKKKLSDIWTVPDALKKALDDRFANRESPRFSVEISDHSGNKAVLSVATFSPRSRAPETVRLTLREPDEAAQKTERIMVERTGNVRGASPLWNAMLPEERTRILELAARRVAESIPDQSALAGARLVTIRFSKEDVLFPFRPVQGHWLGIDSSGRDVLARLLYGLRTSLLFGFLLVVATMVVGVLVGAVQGYYGGATDIISQRVIEIWDSLPFLYILILMGSVFGRSFTLLLVCYGIFNWVGISYYMRAEFLRLRRQAFVEAARCLGLPGRRIILKHILPNALVPVITFFPFSLVGAIGILAALDYLGFGMPPPTPSWGELLSQAQEYSWAWWLTLYPSVILFVVMLLGVFVGEGVRSAFDPKRFSRME